MLGIQPWVTPHDYTSAVALNNKLNTYFSDAQQRGSINPSTVAVLPEYMGTWLVASGEKRSVFTASDVNQAMTTVALTHLPQFLYYYFTAPAVMDKAKWALFTLKGETMAAEYQQVFGGLAKRYGLHLVAGSIVLPNPSLRDGELVVEPGKPLYNVTAVFGPDGHVIAPLVFKAFPISDEQTFTASGDPKNIPLFRTPAGVLSVLICADAWFPAAYATAKQGNAQLIAVPSFSSGNGAWSHPWGGYNGAPNASDVDTTDIHRLSEKQAWQKYSMLARAPAHGIANGVNVFLRGDLWDLGSDGTTLALHDGKAHTGEITDNAVITNVWIP
jgi:predicted amidohydrolase